MTRKRRSNRCANPSQPNQYVMVFAYWRVPHDRRTWWYLSMTLGQARRMVERREATEIELQTETGPTIAFQELWTPAMRSREDSGRKTYRSPATLTLATMNAIAVAEPGVKLSPAERAQVEKLTVWPLVGDTKAAAVRPRMSDEQRRQAEKLLGYPNRPGKPMNDSKRKPQIGVLRNELATAA